MSLTFMLAAQLLFDDPKPWSPGCIDYLNEISYFDASKKLKLKLPREFSEKQVLETIKTDSINIVAWKMLFDLSRQLDDGKVFIRSYVENENINFRKPERFIGWRYISSYLSDLSTTYGMFSKIKNEPTWGVLEKKLGKNWTKAKSYEECFIQMVTSQEGDLDTVRRLSSIYHKRYSHDYYFHHWYANGFRTGRLNGVNKANIELFRSESLEMTKLFPDQPTPHFTVAMTSKDPLLAESEAKKYLSLEKRETKKNWISKVRQKFPNLSR